MKDWKTLLSDFWSLENKVSYRSSQGARFISLEIHVTINVHELDQEEPCRQFASKDGKWHKAPLTLFHCGKLWEEWVTRTIWCTASPCSHLHCSNPCPPNNRERKVQK